MKPEPEPPEANVARTVMLYLKGFDGRSGSITLHIHNGKVTRIEDKKSITLATDGLPSVA